MHKTLPKEPQSLSESALAPEQERCRVEGEDVLSMHCPFLQSF